MIRRVGLALLLLLSPLCLSGCVLNNILDDIVNAPPRAVIDAKPTDGTAPLAVSLDAHYSRDDDGSITEYRWDFGDPSSATGTQLGSSCTHTYPYPGTYLVKLWVTDNEGATDSQEVAIVVTNAPPVPEATVSDSSPYPGDSVTFDASASHDATGTIASYAWDFGDGSTGVGAKVTHTYTKGGTYTVKLTLTDNEGASSDTTLTMTVRSGSSCGGGTCGGDSSPVAVISGLPSSCSPGRVGCPVSLDGTYSVAAKGSITSYAWDFGDGSTGSGGIVSHTYTTGGSFRVTLTVTDDQGRAGSTIGYCHITSSCSGGGCYQ